MKLCLHCLTSSPAQAVYCRCKRTFGCRICVNGHHNGLSATVCGTCGTAQLSPGGIYLPLGWLVLVVWFCSTVWLIHWTFHHTPTIASGLAWVVGSIFSTTRSLIPNERHSSGMQTLESILILMVMLMLIPGELGQRLRRVVYQFFRLGWAIVDGVVGTIFSLGKGSKGH